MELTTKLQEMGEAFAAGIAQYFLISLNGHWIPCKFDYSADKLKVIVLMLIHRGKI